MADLGIGQYFDPVAIAQAVTPDTGALRERWDMYLNSPETQAALLSFGGQAAQPRQWGQSNFGHLMSSVAQGGAGVRQEKDIQRKDQEADSKSQLRESQALLAETRAGTATANANTAGSRLELARVREEGLNQRSQLQRRLQAYKLYGDYVKGVQKANQNAAFTPGGKEQPIIPPNEWFSQNAPLMQSIGLTPEMLSSPAPGGAGTPVTDASTPGASPAPPTGAPPPVASRPNNYIYNHPTRGPMRWDAGQQRWFAVGSGGQ